MLIMMSKKVYIPFLFLRRQNNSFEFNKTYFDKFICIHYFEIQQKNVCLLFKTPLRMQFKQGKQCNLLFK